jgi:hypothetical protein
MTKIPPQVRYLLIAFLSGTGVLMRVLKLSFKREKLEGLN